MPFRSLHVTNVQSDLLVSNGEMSQVFLSRLIILFVFLLVRVILPDESMINFEYYLLHNLYSAFISLSVSKEAEIK